MNTNTLTSEDLDILIEGLDAWISKGFAGEMMGDILGSILIKEGDDPEAFAKMKLDRNLKMQVRKQEERVRTRQATILKAKLYELQANLDTDGIMETITSKPSMER